MRQFTSVYGVLEKVTTIEAADNACSKAKVTTTVKRRPGASPLLFGGFLMNLAAFVSLEDISDALPSYQEGNRLFADRPAISHFRLATANSHFMSTR